METKNLEYRIAFSMLKGISIALAQQILDACGSERDFFEMSPVEVGNIMRHAGHAYCQTTYRAELLERGKREAEFVQQNHVRCIYFADAAYPGLLAQCDDAPLMLYAMGRVDLNGSPCLSVVGTRHSSRYGQDFTEKMIADLSRDMAATPVIISGLAYGIDITAHRAAMHAGVPTVAVLAHGLDTLYPAAHRAEAVKMIEGAGMLLTEYPHGTDAHRGNFLARNRIVAGLSQGVVVVESPMRSGSLSTARLAADYDREVFAVPGRVNDIYSEGCNHLIARQKAQLITKAKDIMDALNYEKRVKISLFEEPEAEMPQAKRLSDKDAEILGYLAHNGATSLSKMALALNKTHAQLRATLTDLELRGLLRGLPGGTYEKC